MGLSQILSGLRLLATKICEKIRKRETHLELESDSSWRVGMNSESEIERKRQSLANVRHRVN